MPLIAMIIDKLEYCPILHNWHIKPHTWLHNSFHPTIRDGSTWRKFGARGEHGDVFLFSNLGVLWFSENWALVLGEFDVLIKIFIASLFKGSQEQSFFLQTLLFMAFLVTILKNLTFALVSTWSLVRSGWEHVKRKMHPWPHIIPKIVNTIVIVVVNIVLFFMLMWQWAGFWWKVGKAQCKAGGGFPQVVRLGFLGGIIGIKEGERPRSSSQSR